MAKHAKTIVGVALREDKLHCALYECTGAEVEELRHIECSDNATPPTGYYRAKPNWESELLSEGKARLKDITSAPPELCAAQSEAIRNRSGIWASAEVVERVEFAPLAATVARRTDGHLRWAITCILCVLAAVAALAVGYVHQGWLGVYGVLVAEGLGGTFVLVRNVSRWTVYRHVTLMALGAPASGKSSLLVRLGKEEATDADFERAESTRVSHLSEALKSFGWGTKEIYPYLIDHAGADSAKQVKSLYEMKGFSAWIARVRRERRIWLIALSLGPGCASATPDREFLAFQAGYLALPCGLLGANHIDPPDGVIIAICKFDAASEFDGDKKKMDEVRAPLEMQLSCIEAACRAADVPCAIVFCAAHKGWGRLEIFEKMGKMV